MAHIVEADRKSGRVYVVRWRDRGFKQRTFTVKRDAERFALRVENEIADGAMTDQLVRRGATVADVVAASLEASALRLKPRTISGYREIYDRRVLPEFGERRVTAVTRAEVEARLGRLIAEGRAPATLHHHYVAL